uniref:Calponin-homology (CH) domain-containing protein n=1 Tax=Amphilophus citrinellus TaxID=61819 RepID=A0A3Q0RMG5_AMPCI
MAVHVTLSRTCSYNRYELLAWLNETLQTSFTRVEQVCTGAAYCQLMDLLFPGSLDLSGVQFQCDTIMHSLHNFTLLRSAFKRAGVIRHIPIEALMKRNPVVALTFLQWFKLLFDERNDSREYNASEARGGQNLPGVCSPAPAFQPRVVISVRPFWDGGKSMPGRTPGFLQSRG